MNLDKLLFFDLEWVPITNTYGELERSNPALAQAWERYVQRQKELGKSAFLDKTIYDLWWEEAGFLPEFSRIIVAVFGYVKNNELQLIKFHGDEIDVLTECKKLLDRASSYSLCGHAIKRYDMPWLAKRIAINGLVVPSSINLWNKKPWESTAIDTSEVWSFGCPQEKYTSLDVLAASLGVESPKGELSGALVKNYYYNGRLDEIVEYCANDVKCVYEIVNKISPLL